MNELEERWRELGQFIRDQRRLGQLSLRKLSEMAGISNPYLSQIERGLRKPSAEILRQIAQALQISAETLYVRAGILDMPDDGADPVRAIHRDPFLSEDHKKALIHIYESFRADYLATVDPGPGEPGPGEPVLGEPVLGRDESPAIEEDTVDEDQSVAVVAAAVDGDEPVGVDPTAAEVPATPEDARPASSPRPSRSGPGGTAAPAGRGRSSPSRPAPGPSAEMTVVLSGDTDDGRRPDRAPATGESPGESAASVVDG
jgi:transcriptional regulator with XRE-family HTH domain